MAMKIALLLATFAGTSRASTLQQISDFDWTTVVPSADLRFTACYKGFECARLIVPLDWTKDINHAVNQPTVTIALLKQPALVTPNDPTYGGTVIMNPGGPGGSGVSFLLSNGEYLRRMVDTSQRHFEILSFDPRGIGLTTPSADCYRGSLVRSLANAQSTGMGYPDQNSSTSLTYALSMSSAEGLQCEATSMKANGFIIQEYMSTASVARDMLRMVDKMAVANLPDIPHPNKTASLPRLRYLGFSYGTYLGMTFASMFPGRVHRMVLDGVVHPEQYTNGVCHHIPGIRSQYTNNVFFVPSRTGLTSYWTHPEVWSIFTKHALKQATPVHSSPTLMTLGMTLKRGLMILLMPWMRNPYHSRYQMPDPSS